MSRHRLVVDSPVGPLTLVAADGALTHCEFGERAVDGAADGADHPMLVEAARQLAEYFAGERTDFRLMLRLSGNDFDLEAWRALTTIPYGETISYGEQAERIDKPGAQQAVGAANGRNPIVIIVPCHRVIGADGKLVGFGGGLDKKRYLLDLESGTQRLPFG